MYIRHSRRVRALALFLLTLDLATPMATRADTLSQRANRGLVEVVAGSIDGTAVRMASDISDLLDDGLPVVGKGRALPRRAQSRCDR